MKAKILGLLALGLLVGPAVAGAAAIVDTGTPPTNTGDGLTINGTGRAGQFAISSTFQISSLQWWAGVYQPQTFSFSIYSNDTSGADAMPGSLLFTTSQFQSATFAGDFIPAWIGPASGLNWTLGAGTYWMVVEGAAGLSDTLDFRAPYCSGGCSLTVPLEAERVLNGGVWNVAGARTGWLMNGTTVPEPATLALLGLGLAGLGMSRRRKMQ